MDRRRRQILARVSKKETKVDRDFEINSRF